MVHVTGLGVGTRSYRFLRPEVTTLDMSASGINKKDIDEVQTFHDYSLPLLEFMKSLPPGEKVILVGHSLGGLNIALASEKFPHKVSVSVFLGAIMPDTVHSPSYAIDQYVERTPGDYWMDTQFYVSSGKDVLLFGPQNLSSNIYQLCSPEDVALAKMLVRPSSMFREDLSKQEKFTENGFGAVKRVYIVIAKHDLAAAEEFQYWQIENAGVSEIKIADVWSCGVTLYVMLVGSYPFEDPNEPKDFRKTISRILNVQYTIPDHVSEECRQLISRIFVADPTQRINMNEIRSHPWFLRNLPAEMMDDTTLSNQFEEPDQPMQSLDTIMQIISEATIPPAGMYNFDMMDDDMDDLDDLDSDPDLDVDSSGEVIYAI